MKTLIEFLLFFFCGIIKTHFLFFFFLFSFSRFLCLIVKMYVRTIPKRNKKIPPFEISTDLCRWTSFILQVLRKHISINTQTASVYNSKTWTKEFIDLYTFNSLPSKQRSNDNSIKTLSNVVNKENVLQKKKKEKKKYEKNIHLNKHMPKVMNTTNAILQWVILFLFVVVVVVGSWFLCCYFVVLSFWF